MTSMPTKVIWSDEFSVGHKVLDNQHKMIINVINELIESYGLLDIDIHNILDTLHRYITVHLRYEEKLLEECGYSDLDEHKKQHAVFEEKIAETCSLLETKWTKGIDTTKTELLAFLHSWWNDHILIQDKKYEPYIGEGG